MMTPGSSPSTIQTGKELRTASTVLFLALCCALGLHTLFVIRVGQEGSSSYSSDAGGPLIEVTSTVGGSSKPGPFGRRHGALFLLTIIALFLVKEIYLVATLSQISTNETLFYCLAVLPEFIAVLLFAVPGLVPGKDEVDRAHPDGVDGFSEA